MTTLMSQSFCALIALALLVDFFGLHKCLSTAGAVASSCGPVVTHQRTRKSARDPNSEELSGTPHLRTPCGSL
jgi:hypothetical protein